MFYNQKTNRVPNKTLYYRKHKFDHKILEKVRNRDLHTRRNEIKGTKNRWKTNEMNTETTEHKKKVENQWNEHRNNKTETIRDTTYRWHIGASTQNQTQYIRLSVSKKVENKREYRKRREAQKNMKKNE